MLRLTAYFDESGHPNDPDLHFVGIAGFVAPTTSWAIFESQWKGALADAGLTEPFHMRDFSHSTGQFAAWKGKEEKRRLLFGRLVEIIAGTKATPIGAVVSIHDFQSLTSEQQSQLVDPYYVCFQTCTRGAAIKAVFEKPAEKVAMVYAFHDEYGTNKNGRAEQLWQAIKQHVTFSTIGARMGSYASSTPAEITPLQAADLFAYELCHEFENHIKRPSDRMRWGLRKILRMYRIPEPLIHLYDRSELLRLILESEIADQTGLEEISETQVDSSRQRINDWLSDRGEYRKEK